MTKIISSLTGDIISDSRNKSLTVIVKRKVKHKTLGKIITKFKKYHVHDESKQYKVGDVVTIVASKPISKTKSWIIKQS